MYLLFVSHPLPLPGPPARMASSSILGDNNHHHHHHHHMHHHGHRRHRLHRWGKPGRRAPSTRREGGGVGRGGEENGGGRNRRPPIMFAYIIQVLWQFVVYDESNNAVQLKCKVNESHILVVVDSCTHTSEGSVVPFCSAFAVGTKVPGCLGQWEQACHLNSRLNPLPGCQGQHCCPCDRWRHHALHSSRHRWTPTPSQEWYP